MEDKTKQHIFKESINMKKKKVVDAVFTQGCRNNIGKKRKQQKQTQNPQFCAEGFTSDKGNTERK